MSRYLHGEDLYEYKGLVYCPEDDVMEDNVKRYHTVRIVSELLYPNEFISVPLTPYGTVSKQLFERWIDMGRPSRDQMGGHHYDNHEAYYQKYLDSILLGE